MSYSYVTIMSRKQHNHGKYNFNKTETRKDWKQEICCDPLKWPHYLADKALSLHEPG